jgi:hypothetical protein
MTADEALPYLQVFTPLTFTSHVSPLPPTEGGSGGGSGSTPLPLQHHTITASSTHPRGLFTARIDMTVNTKTMAIAALAVPRLEPAAEGELRPFVQRVVAKGAGHDAAATDNGGRGAVPPSSGVYNNVGVLAWGMGEWLRVAVQRAKVWGVLEREVGGGKEVLRGVVGRLRKGQKRRRRRRRGGGGDGDEDEGEEGEDEDGDGDGEGSMDGIGGRFETADLLPFMGRTRLDLEVPVLDGGGQGEVSTLRVQWRILFDWTGEARSEIGVLVGVPGKCEYFWAPCSNFKLLIC